MLIACLSPFNALFYNSDTRIISKQTNIHLLQIMQFKCVNVRVRGVTHAFLLSFSCTQCYSFGTASAIRLLIPCKRSFSCYLYLSYVRKFYMCVCLQIEHSIVYKFNSFSFDLYLHFIQTLRANTHSMISCSTFSRHK